jgi:hypothetical protein
VVRVCTELRDYWGQWESEWGDTAELQALLGNWQFRFVIGTVAFTAQYALTGIDTASLPYPAITGSDGFGELITVARFRDVDPTTSVPRTFLLVDPGTIICNTFAFDQTSPTTLVGEYLQLTADCSAPSVGSGTLYPMTAIRTGAVLSEPEQPMIREQQAFAEAARLQGLSHASAYAQEIVEIVRTLMQQTRVSHLYPTMVR